MQSLSLGERWSTKCDGEGYTNAQAFAGGAEKRVGGIFAIK